VKPGTNKAVLVQFLNKLMRPNSISGDAQGMHGVILSIVSSHLLDPLRSLQAKEPSRYNIEPLVEDLKSHLDYKRSATSTSVNEIQHWTNTPSGGMRQALRNTLSSLVSWGAALPTGMLVPAPNYTHRQIITAIDLLGADIVLSTFIDEIKLQTEQGNGPLALDIITEIVLAPTPSHPPDILTPEIVLGAHRPPPSTISLRTALKRSYADAPKLLDKDSASVEAIVRLHRRVESLALDTAQQAQLAAVPPDLNTQDINMMNAVDLAAADGADPATAAAAADAVVDAAVAEVTAAAAAATDEQAALELAMVQPMEIDAAAAAAAAAGQTMDPGAMDDILGVEASVDELLAQGGLGGGGGELEDDIFGDLQMDPENSFNFDELGM
jgi:mediator of RNA polymerase II transcription subunit 5